MCWHTLTDKSSNIEYYTVHKSRREQYPGLLPLVRCAAVAGFGEEHERASQVGSVHLG